VVAIESNGLIRDDLLRGKTGALSVTDVFAAIPLASAWTTPWATP